MRKSRDQVVSDGAIAKAISESSLNQKGPWLYKAKVKSGNKATRNIEEEYCNIPHLNGELIVKYAVEGETLNVYAVQRLMKSHMRSIREDR